MRVRVDTGAGGDQVALVDSVFAGIAVDTGVGNDQVAIAGVRARTLLSKVGRGMTRCNSSEEVALATSASMDLNRWVEAARSASNRRLVGFPSTPSSIG